ncbi:hypothetical protein CTI12_AA188690 [Artemisia annua]|uniref:Uncharacterized protein n=1 Tax=Artemisia annua TaxID=35608 RepID=A0A2U1P6J6_ARTAN|nr:hypothetical protein CTI12_AA188690 [Artemisia annua]
MGLINHLDGRVGEITEPTVDRDFVHSDNLDNEDDFVALDCVHDSYHNTSSPYNVGMDEGHSSLNRRDVYNIISPFDVSPIEVARARFLDFIVDNFISSHVVEVTNCETDAISQSVEEDLSNKKARRSVCGLYRKLAKKFPINGPCTFKRRELTTSVETRSRFPELVVGTPEKMRFRVCVVIGLDIIEKPIVEQIDDAEWFKRLTGRSDLVVFPHDYKFNAPRHKYRRAQRNPISGYFRSRLEAPPTAKFCDVCGSRYKRGISSFCLNCGVKKPEA